MVSDAATRGSYERNLKKLNVGNRICEEAGRMGKTNASENKYHQSMTVAYSMKTTKSCESSVNENM
jgi:hypothetical protein